MKSPALDSIREALRVTPTYERPPTAPYPPNAPSRLPSRLIIITFSLLSLAGCAYNWNKPIGMSVEEAKKIILKDAQDQLDHPVVGVSGFDNSLPSALTRGNLSGDLRDHWDPMFRITDEYILEPFVAWSLLTWRSTMNEVYSYPQNGGPSSFAIGLRRVYFKQLSPVETKRDKVAFWVGGTLCCFLLNPTCWSDSYHSTRTVDPEMLIPPPRIPDSLFPNPVEIYLPKKSDISFGDQMESNFNFFSFVFPFYLVHPARPSKVALAYEVMIRNANAQSTKGLNN